MEDLLAYRDAAASDARVLAHHRFAGDAAGSAEHEAYERWVASRVAAQTYLGRVAVAGSAVVAGAGLVLLDWGPTRGNVSGVCGRVVAVFTEPAWRRQGLAARLVREVLQRGRDLGVRDFRLAASPEGADLYRALGFRHYGAEMILKG